MRKFNRFYGLDVGSIPTSSKNRALIRICGRAAEGTGLIIRISQETTLVRTQLDAEINIKNYQSCYLI